MTARLQPWHLLAALLFVALGFALAYSSPFAAEYSPQLAALRRRTHAVTLSRDSLNTALQAAQRRDSVRGVQIAALEAHGALAASQTHSLAVENGSLARRLAGMKPESVIVYAERLAQGIAAQDSACSAALHDCAAVKDTLRAQIASRDTLITGLRAVSDSAVSVMGAAVSADSAAETVARRRGRQLWATRVVAGILIVLAWFR